MLRFFYCLFVCTLDARAKSIEKKEQKFVVCGWLFDGGIGKGRREHCGVFVCLLKVFSTFHFMSSSLQWNLEKTKIQNIKPRKNLLRFHNKITELSIGCSCCICSLYWNGIWYDGGTWFVVWQLLGSQFIYGKICK